MMKLIKYDHVMSYVLPTAQYAFSLMIVLKPLRDTDDLQTLQQLFLRLHVQPGIRITSAY